MISNRVLYLDLMPGEVGEQVKGPYQELGKIVIANRWK